MRIFSQNSARTFVEFTGKRQGGREIIPRLFESLVDFYLPPHPDPPPRRGEGEGCVPHLRKEEKGVCPSPRRRGGRREVGGWQALTSTNKTLTLWRERSDPSRAGECWFSGNQCFSAHPSRRVLRLREDEGFASAAHHTPSGGREQGVRFLLCYSFFFPPLYGEGRRGWGYPARRLYFCATPPEPGGLWSLPVLKASRGCPEYGPRPGG